MAKITRTWFDDEGSTIAEVRLTSEESEAVSTGSIDGYSIAPTKARAVSKPRFKLSRQAGVSGLVWVPGNPSAQELIYPSTGIVASRERFWAGVFAGWPRARLIEAPRA